MSSTIDIELATNGTPRAEALLRCVKDPEFTVRVGEITS